MEVEEALQKLGKVGKWQVAIFMITFLMLHPSMAWNMVSIVFLAYEPPHHCKPPANASVDEWIPRDSSGELSSCSMFVNSSISNQTTSCVHGWHFEQSSGGPTMVTKWDLVCHRAHLPGFSQMMLCIGLAIGGVLLAKPTDKYGRKWNFLINIFLMSVFGIFSAFTDSFNWFSFHRFMVGVFTGGSVLNYMVYQAESFSVENKPLFIIVGYGVWGVNFALLVPLAYFIPDWIKLQLLISIYPLVFMPFLMWWMPETVPWLYANNRVEEAENVLLRAAKLNDVILNKPILMRPDDKLPSIELRRVSDKKNEKKAEKEERISFIEKDSKDIAKGVSVEVKTSTHPAKAYSVLELFRNRYLLRHMSFGITVLIANVVFYGVSYIGGSITSRRFISTFLNFFMEVPVCCVDYFIIKRFGYKQTTIWYLILSSITMFLCVVVLAFVDKENVSLYIVILTVLCKLFVGGAWAIIFIYGAEIFPTNLRNQAVGICYVVGRMGNILASFTPFFHSLSPEILYASLGFSGLVGALLCLLLPETSHRALPETVGDIEAWYKEDAEQDTH